MGSGDALMCRACGARLRKEGPMLVNADDLKVHTCSGRAKVKVYTKEEIEEMNRQLAEKRRD